MKRILITFSVFAMSLWITGNADNQSPTLTCPTTTVPVLENATIGTVVFTCNGSDPDPATTPNGTLSYNIQAGNQARRFAADAITGEVHIIQKLDYETTKNYIISVGVFDGAGSGVTATVTVDVGDVNDNDPTCTPTVVWGMVNENQPTNTSFAHFNCSDPDSISVSTLVYQVQLGNSSGSRSDTIGVDPKTRSCFTKRPIDYDTEQDVFQLTVTVSDQGSPPRTSDYTVSLAVLNLDDNTPIFSPSTYTGNVTENSPLGFKILTVSAIDADRGNTPASLITYNSNCMPNVVMVDQRSGDCVVAKDIDADVVKVITCNVTAHSESSGTSTASIHITVNNLNDRKPVFEQPFYSVSVAESSLVGAIVIGVSAVDPDGGPVTYSISSANFSINSTGVVTLAFSPDYEKETAHFMTLTAIDSGSPQLSSTSKLQVIIRPVNEFRPVFTNNSCSSSIPENTAAGTTLLKVSAFDNDTGNDGVLTYSISPPTVPFTIDPDTGEIGLVSPVDYETRSQYIFEVDVTDNSSISPKSNKISCTVYITDVNDQDLKCQQPSVVHIYYPFFIGYAVNVVSCTPNTTLTYNILAGNPNKTFSMNNNYIFLDNAPVVQQNILTIEVRTGGGDSTNVTAIVFAELMLNFTNLPATINVPEEVMTGLMYTVQTCCVFPTVQFLLLRGNGDSHVTFTSSNGEMRLMVPYDREVKGLYEYVIKAISSRQSATSTLTVIVSDINDKTASFLSELDEIHIDEGWPTNTQIKRYPANDTDLGNNSTLTYFIASGDPNDYFGINSTGSLFLKKSLNYLLQNMYQLVISAKDGGQPQLTGSMTVVVYVEISNRTSPVFVPLPGNYSTSISEATALGKMVFQLQASNANNVTGNFVYAIYSGNTDDVFQIVPTNGTIFLVKFLDRERTASYNLSVSATNEHGRNTTAVVAVEIADENDNYPVFSEAVYSFTVADQENPGKIVGNLSVKDADAGANGNVTLTLDSGNTGNAFSLSGYSLVTQIPMNYLMVNYYRMKVTGTDGGSPPRRSSVIVVVNVIHGNIPFFNITSYTVTVQENETIGKEIIDVNATGLAAAEDGSLIYAIQQGSGGKFMIRSITGAVVLIGELDYELSQIYNIIITATDSNKQNTATCTLIVNVTDVNDNSPVFNPETYTFNVPELTPNWVSPPPLALATDADSGTNGLAYETITGCPEFDINPSSGVIRPKLVLDYLVTQYCSCRIVATDGGTPPRQAIASAVMIIKDINNHDPTISGPTYVNVLDSVPIKSYILKLHVNDLDTGDAGNLSCSIVSSPNPSAFTIDPTTCMIQTAEVLDTKQYTFVVMVTDHGQPSRNVTATITVNVTSANTNDHDPTYSPTCPRSVPVSRTASMGTVAFSCPRTDLDKGDSGQLVSWIISGNDDGHFIMNKDTGDILTAASLLTANDVNNMVIFTSDKGKPSRNTSLSVIITVVPQMTTNTTTDYTYTIPENSPVNSLVGVINVDPPRTVSGYDISDGNVNNTFGVQKQSNGAGNIIVNVPPDREKCAQYSLLVSAKTDVGDSIKAVKIVILDQNDNPPAFAVTRVDLNVPENTPRGVALATVPCTDEDTDAVNRNNRLSVSTTDFGIDQSGTLVTASDLDYETKSSYTFNIICSDTPNKYSTSLPVTVTLIDVPEQENVSTSAVTDNPLISREIPYQASIGDLVYTMKPGDFGLIPGATAYTQYVYYQSSNPFSVHSITGDITVAGSLAKHVKYLLWAMILVFENGTTTSRTCLFRIDTFDRDEEMIVIEFSQPLSDVQSRIEQFQQRVQAFFQPTQRVGFCKLVETSTGSRRRLLAQQSAAYTYVVSNTSSDNIENVNNPKTFLKQSDMLRVLQQSPDGTPTPGLSDSSVADVDSVSPYQDSSSSDSFEGFINTPAGIAVFVLLGLLILVILIIIATCIYYRKCRNRNKKSKNSRNKASPRKTTFSRVPESAPPNHTSNVPNIIVSAPPSSTQHNPPSNNFPTPPPIHNNYDNDPDSMNASYYTSNFATQTDPSTTTRSNGKQKKSKANKAKRPKTSRNT